MAYNEKLTERVRQSLAGVPNVEEKKMFRGVAFMVEGKMCISAGDNTIMCRIDPELYETAITKKGCTGMVMKGREYRGYVNVNVDELKTKKEFDYWITLALEFNKRAKASPKKKKK